jgi:hypothetical protein
MPPTPTCAALLPVDPLADPLTIGQDVLARFVLKELGVDRGQICALSARFVERADRGREHPRVDAQVHEDVARLRLNQGDFPRLAAWDGLFDAALDRELFSTSCSPP